MAISNDLKNIAKTLVDSTSTKGPDLAQKTAWDLGNDKKLSKRVTIDLQQNADLYLKKSSDKATIKEFRDDTIKELTKNGIGEKDAANLLDQFIASDFSKPDENSSLKDARDKSKTAFTSATSAASSGGGDLTTKPSSPDDRSVHYDDQGNLLPGNPPSTQKTAWQLGNDKSLSGRVFDDISKNADAFLNSSRNATVKDFHEFMVKDLKNNGVGEKDAISVMDQFTDKAGVKSDDPLGKVFDNANDAKLKAEIEARSKQMGRPIANAKTTESPTAPVSTQQIAWDLGSDKKLSQRVIDGLVNNAVAFAGTSKDATMKDFRDHMVAELGKHGVGEQDASGLMDQFAEYAGVNNSSKVADALSMSAKPAEAPIKGDGLKWDKITKEVEDRLKDSDVV